MKAAKSNHNIHHPAYKRIHSILWPNETNKFLRTSRALRCKYAVKLPLKITIKNNISNQFEISSIFASVLRPFFHLPVAFQMNGICCFSRCMQIHRSLCSIFLLLLLLLLLPFGAFICHSNINSGFQSDYRFSAMFSFIHLQSWILLFSPCMLFVQLLFSESKLTQHTHTLWRWHTPTPTQRTPAHPRTHTVKIDYCFAMFYLILFVSLLLLPFVPKEAKRYVFSCEILRMVYTMCTRFFSLRSCLRWIFDMDVTIL